MLSLSPSRFNIEHITEINAPISTVWEALVDINDWEWNKWTKLVVVVADIDDNNKAIITEGTKGKLHASYEGGGNDDDDEWKIFDFEFGEVNHENRILCWFGKVGPAGCLFSGYHTMRLVEKEKLDEDNDGKSDNNNNNNNKTLLIHSERFGGILPTFGLGLPYKTLNRNYLYMNNSLKEFCEKERKNK